MNGNFKIGCIAVFIILTLMLSSFFSAGQMNDEVDFNTEETHHLSAILGLSDRIIVPREVISENYPEKIAYYKVIGADFDDELSSECMSTQENIPSEEKAKIIAEEYIKANGGLPEDAIFKGVQEQYLKKKQGKEEIEEIPLLTEVTYRREINGVPVVGPGDFILVSIGENEKVLCYIKTWKRIEKAGQMDIINVYDAIEKLENGNYMDIPLSPYDHPITINKISIGYYSQAKGIEQEFYKPVWIFNGTSSHGEEVNISIDASTT